MADDGLKVMREQLETFASIRKGLVNLDQEIADGYFNSLILTIIGAISADGKITDLEYGYYVGLKKIMKETPYTKQQLYSYILVILDKAKESGENFRDIQRKHLVRILELTKQGMPEDFSTALIALTYNLLIQIVASDADISDDELTFMEPFIKLAK